MTAYGVRKLPVKAGCDHKLFAVSERVPECPGVSGMSGVQGCVRTGVTVH